MEWTHRFDQLLTLSGILLAIAQTFLALAAIVVGAIVSVVIYKGGRTLTKMQYMRSSFDAWMTLDTFLLSSTPEIRAMARKIERPDLVNKGPRIR